MTEIHSLHWTFSKQNHHIDLNKDPPDLTDETAKVAGPSILLKLYGSLYE
jgi:hypothetical protein